MLATMAKTKMMKKDADSSPWHREGAKKARNPIRNQFKIMEKKSINVPNRKK